MALTLISTNNNPAPATTLNKKGEITLATLKTIFTQAFGLKATATNVRAIFGDDAKGLDLRCRHNWETLLDSVDLLTFVRGGNSKGVETIYLFTAIGCAHVEEVTNRKDIYDLDYFIEHYMFYVKDEAERQAMEAKGRAWAKKQGYRIED